MGCELVFSFPILKLQKHHTHTICVSVGRRGLSTLCMYFVTQSQSLIGWFCCCSFVARPMRIKDDGRHRDETRSPFPGAENHPAWLWLVTVTSPSPNVDYYFSALVDVIMGVTTAGQSPSSFRLTLTLHTLVIIALSFLSCPSLR